MLNILLVTVFDSSAVTEPFLDSVALDALRKQQHKGQERR